MKIWRDLSSTRSCRGVGENIILVTKVDLMALKVEETHSKGEVMLLGNRDLIL